MVGKVIEDSSVIDLEKLELNELIYTQKLPVLYCTVTVIICEDSYYKASI